jgi:hypothetical protein
MDEPNSTHYSLHSRGRPARDGSGIINDTAESSGRRFSQALAHASGSGTRGSASVHRRSVCEIPYVY